MSKNIAEVIEDGPVLSVAFLEPGNPGLPELTESTISIFISFNGRDDNHENDCLLEPDVTPLTSLLSMEDCLTYYRIVVWFVVEPVSISEDDQLVFCYRFSIDITDPESLKKFAVFLAQGADIVLGAGIWGERFDEVTVKWFQKVEDVFCSETEMGPVIQELLGIDELSELQMESY